MDLEGGSKALDLRGLKVKRTKTECMCIEQQSTKQPIRCQDQLVPEIVDFKLQGSLVHEHGHSEIKGRIRFEAGLDNRGKKKQKKP